MKSAAILVLFTVVVASTQIVDYRLALNLGKSTDVKPCRLLGLFCESCSSAVMCRFAEDGVNFTKMVVDTCTASEMCLNGTCVKDQFDPLCDGTASLPFECNSVGIFPDPFYCNKFVMCVEDSKGKLVAYPHECNEGYGYDDQTGLCSVKLNDEICSEDPKDYPVPLCVRPGDNGPIPNANPAKYFTCVVRNVLKKERLYPVIDQCPNGRIYQGNIGCIDPGTVEDRREKR